MTARALGLRLLLAGVLGSVTACAATVTMPPPAISPPGGASEQVATGRAPRPPVVQVLRAWDRARARAYAAGSAAALRALYVPGSAAGAADVRVLRGYLTRGLRVEGMRTQLIAVRVLDHDPRSWRVRVTDRLAGAFAVGHGQRVRLPRDQASRRDLLLARRADGGWRVVSVHAHPG